MRREAKPVVEQNNQIQCMLQLVVSGRLSLFHSLAEFLASASQQASPTMAYNNDANVAFRSFPACSLHSPAAPIWSVTGITPALLRSCARWLPAQPSHCVLLLQSTYGSSWLHLPTTSRKLPWCAPARSQLTAGSSGPARAVHAAVLLLVLLSAATGVCTTLLLLKPRQPLPLCEGTSRQYGRHFQLGCNRPNSTRRACAGQFLHTAPSPLATIILLSPPITSP